MIAQTMVEYGAVNSIAAAFANFINRVESFAWSGDRKYIFFLALAVLVGLIATRRRH